MSKNTSLYEQMLTLNYDFAILNMAIRPFLKASENNGSLATE